MLKEFMIIGRFRMVAISLVVALTAASCASEKPSEKTSGPDDDFPAIRMSASELGREFETNGDSADRMYLGKRVRLSGTADSFNNRDKVRVLVFKASIDTYVPTRCFFEGSTDAQIEQGDDVTVEGVVAGFRESTHFVDVENCRVP